MSFDREDIFKVVRAAADDLNATQPDDERFDPAETATLAGDGGTLSSLALVTFVVGVEERLTEALGRPVTLFDETLITAPDGPFRTVGRLVDHIQSLVRDSAP